MQLCLCLWLYSCQTVHILHRNPRQWRYYQSWQQTVKLSSQLLLPAGQHNSSPPPGGSHRHRCHHASWQGQKPGRYARPPSDHVCTHQQDLLGGLLPPARHRPHSPLSDCGHHWAPCPCLRYIAAGHGKCAVLRHHPGPAAASAHTEQCSTPRHQDRPPPSHQAHPSATALVACGAAYPLQAASAGLPHPERSGPSLHCRVAAGTRAMQGATLGLTESFGCTTILHNVGRQKLPQGHSPALELSAS